MRVGIDVSPLTANRTGVGNYTYYQLKHLLMQTKDMIFKGFSSGLVEVDLGGLPEIGTHRHIPLPTRVVYKSWDWFNAPKVDGLLGGIDVYHATNYYLPPVKRTRRVVTFYDLAFLREPKWCSPRIVGPFSAGVRRFSKEADHILTCSEATRRDVITLLDVAEEKVSVAYGAVNEDFAAMQRPEAVDLLARVYNLRQPYLLYVSTIEPRKNVEGLLRAFALASKEIPHKLVLVGATGWNAEGINPLIASLGLEDRVMRMGYVQSRSHLPAFYGAADAFLFPSFYEGFGLPVVEAMTCGCPVITSNRASLPEVGGDAAQYVNPDDVEGMSATIQMVVGNERLRESMSAKGKLQAAKFSWSACATQTAQVYRGLY